MSAWLIPALKAVLPHVGTILSAAAPVFTRKQTNAAASQTLLLQQQIAELQAAASQNAEHVKELAAQLESIVASLEEAASIAELKARRVFWLCIAATVLSATALCAALFAAYAR